MNKLFLILFVTILAIACKKEPDLVPDDTDLPSLTITGINKNDTLRNTIAAEIKGTDSIGIKSIEVFANDALIVSSIQSPVNLNWNTLNFKDGNYNIKVVSTNNKGTKKELSIAVVIQNALFSFDPNDYDRLSQSVAYIVTDANGKILNSFKFTNSTAPKAGERTEIYPTTNFTGTHVNVVRVQKMSSYSIEYFLNLKRGHYAKAWKSFAFNYSSPELGQRKIALKNIPSTFGQSVCGSIDGSTSTFQFQPNPNFIRYTTDSKVLVMYEKNSDFMYHLFDVNKPGGDVQELDISLCTSKALSKTISFPTGAQNGNLTPWGGPHKNFDEIYHLGNKPVNGNPIKVYYPVELSNLSGTTYFDYQGAYHSRTYYSDLPATIEPVNFNVTLEKRSLTDFNATFNGDFQFYIAKFNQNATTPISVSVVGFKDQLKFKLPDISGEVSIPGFTPAQMPLTSVQMTQYSLPVDVNMLFSWILGPMRQGSRSNYASKIQYF